MTQEMGSVASTYAWDELTLRIPEVARILAISRSMVYELIRRGELPSITIGGSRRVPAVRLREWLERQGA
jgi:excisionase family DNA binding protein